MTNLKFSIIVPVYNVEKYLRKCIESVLAQSYSDYELILVDDGSPDSCPEICDTYARNNKRIRVIHKPNGGLSDARNAGLDIAVGKYVIFLDSDDWWDNPDFLTKLNNTIELGNADIVIFGMKKYYSEKDKIGDIRVPRKYTETIFTIPNITMLQRYMQSNIFVACACDKAIRKETIDNSAQRFVKGQLSEDIEWCCKLLKKDLTIDVLEDAAYVYRQQVSTSITANVSSHNIRCILDILSRYATSDAPLALRHFLANQYVLLITNFMRLPKFERSQFESEIKSYWWLLNYNWYPYARKVSMVKPFGFNVTKILLRLYYLIRR